LVHCSEQGIDATRRYRYRVLSERGTVMYDLMIVMSEGLNQQLTGTSGIHN